jgi:tetratricopeptide (TPR) repeat protein
MAQTETGDYAAAEANLTFALQLHRDLGYRRGEAHRRYSLGMLHRLTSEHQAAAADLARALELYDSIADQLGQAQVLNAIGELSLPKRSAATSKP